MIAFDCIDESVIQADPEKNVSTKCSDDQELWSKETPENEGLLDLLYIFIIIFGPFPRTPSKF